MTHQPVDTRKSTNRRTLNLRTLGDLRAELDRIERAHRAGQLRVTGNWSPGQVFTHLANFINYAYDGYPPELKTPPALLRFCFKFMKNRFLYRPMGAGVKIPGVRGGTVGVEDVAFEQGLARLRAAVDRLEQAAPTQANPMFGPMPHDQWTSLHLRHAELHLGFLSPR
jgi:hypothetical protein